MTLLDPKQYLDREGFEFPDDVSKTIHSGEEFDGQPYAHFDQDSITIAASRKSLIAIDPVFGILFGGPTSFSMMPEQMSFAAGYYRLNPLLLSTVPSTTPTPVPALVKAEPTAA